MSPLNTMRVIGTMILIVVALAVWAIIYGLRPAYGAENITSLPYVNNFESQTDVNNARWPDSEPCVATITYEPTAGYLGTGAFKLRLLDMPGSGACSSKNEDSEGIGDFDLPGSTVYPQINVGFLFKMGPNFTDPLHNDDGHKFSLVQSNWGGSCTSSGQDNRPMVWYRHYGGGSNFKTWGVCMDSGEPCLDEFGNSGSGLNGGTPTSAYSWQPDVHENQWVWFEHQAVNADTNGGQLSFFMFTEDGSISGQFAQTITTCVPSGFGFIGVNENPGYWEGADNTTADSYILIDNFTVSTEYIGPPAGFGEEPPVGGGVPDDVLLLVSQITPSAPVSNNNPDSWPTATETFYANDYDTEVSGDLWDGGSNNVVDATWGANYGWNSSGGWRLAPSGDVNENEAGVDPNVSLPVDGTDTVVISWMHYFTQDLLNNTDGGSTPEWKALDTRMWNESGVGADDGTRQAPLFVKKNYPDTFPPADHPTRVGTGIFYSLITGGAGSNFVYDGVTPQVDFTNEGDQWIWFSVVFDTGGTWVYMKREGDTDVTRVIRRLAGQEAFPGDTYSYNTRGWSLTTNYVFGYWDDVLGIQEPTHYLVVDRVRASNGWLDPPF